MTGNQFAFKKLQRAELTLSDITHSANGKEDRQFIVQTYFIN